MTGSTRRWLRATQTGLTNPWTILGPSPVPLRFLGRKERLQHLVADGGRNSGAGIGHGNHHPTGRGWFALITRNRFVQSNISTLQGQLAATRHRIAALSARLIKERCSQL